MQYKCKYSKFYQLKNCCKLCLYPTEIFVSCEVNATFIISIKHVLSKFKQHIVTTVTTFSAYKNALNHKTTIFQKNNNKKLNFSVRKKKKTIYHPHMLKVVNAS